MYFVIFILLFAAVFAYIGWRVWKSQAPPPQEQFICPHCNERDCHCHKRNQV